MNDEQTFEHESYASVRLTRRSGGHRRLFGSPLHGHSETVVLSIHTCEEKHDLAQSWFFPSHRPIVEVEMSQAQFAQLITTMNVHGGTPATLRSFDGVRKEDPPVRQVEHEMIEEALAPDGERSRNIHKHLDEAMEVLKDALRRKSVRKGDVEEALARVSRAKSIIRSDLPFVLESFREAAEKVKTATMAEADAWLTGVVQRTGIAALRRLPEISGTDEHHEKVWEEGQHADR